MLTLQLLGGFELTGAEGPPLPTRKAEALLAFLALSDGRPQARDRLAALLWSDRGDAQARHSLAQTLYVIRRTLGDSGRDALRTDTRRVSFDPSWISVDALEFLTCSAHTARSALERAGALYCGQLLDGFYIADESFEEWLQGERHRFHAQAMDTLQRLLQQQSEERSDAAAIATAHRQLDLDSLHEPAHRSLMELFGRAGRFDAAVRQFRTCEATLRQELGVEPAPETRALFDAIVARHAQKAPSETNSKMPNDAQDFRGIALDMAQPLHWIQFPYASRDWAPDTHANTDTNVPGGYWARTLGTLSAFVIRKRAALTAANLDYSRVVVTPPSETWPNCSAVPGRVALPGAI
jgi:DNA-binding SARP family transcriptional activator